MNVVCHNTNSFKAPSFLKIGPSSIILALMLFMSNAIQAQATPKYVQYNRMDSARKETSPAMQAKSMPEEKVTKKDRVEDSTSTNSKVEHSIIYEILKRFMIFDMN